MRTWKTNMKKQNQMLVIEETRKKVKRKNYLSQTRGLESTVIQNP